MGRLGQVDQRTRESEVVYHSDRSLDIGETAYFYQGSLLDGCYGVGFQSTTLWFRRWHSVHSQNSGELVRYLLPDVGLTR